MKAFIIFRDRVTYARKCHAALAAAGLDVHVVDHDSTWPAALLWLAELEETGAAAVLRRGENAYPWQLWEWDTFRGLMWDDLGPYLVTDPDVVPAPGCPADWVQHLASVRDRYGAVKAGLALRLDQLPSQRRKELAEREPELWADQPEPAVYRANVDTTLAVYRPWTEYPLFAIGPAIRTGHPYVADHLAWYETGDLTPELEHYYGRADPGHYVPRLVYDQLWRF